MKKLLLGLSLIITVTSASAFILKAPDQLVVHNDIQYASYIKARGNTSPQAHAFTTEHYSWSKVKQLCKNKNHCHANVYVKTDEVHQVKAGDVFFLDLDSGDITAHGKHGYTLHVDSKGEITLKKA